MHTAEEPEAEEPEEEPEEIIILHELPLKTWNIWIRWWHLTSISVQEEGLWCDRSLLEKRDTLCGCSYS